MDYETQEPLLSRVQQRMFSAVGFNQHEIIRKAESPPLSVTNPLPDRRGGNQPGQYQLLPCLKLQAPHGVPYESRM